MEGKSVHCTSCKLCKSNFPAVHDLIRHLTFVHYKAVLTRIAYEFFPTQWDCARCAISNISNILEAVLHVGSVHGKTMEMYEKDEVKVEVKNDDDDIIPMEECSKCGDIVEDVVTLASKQFCQACSKEEMKNPVLQALRDLKKKRLVVKLSRSCVNEHLIQHQPKVVLERIPDPAIDDDDVQIVDAFPVVSPRNDDENSVEAQINPEVPMDVAESAESPIVIEEKTGAITEETMMEPANEAIMEESPLSNKSAAFCVEDVKAENHPKEKELDNPNEGSDHQEAGIEDPTKEKPMVDEDIVMSVPDKVEVKIESQDFMIEKVSANSKSEDVIAKNHKHEVSKAEDSKVEDSKAEDSKVEDSKAEDSKAEDSKAEDSKAEDSKAEDSKAEDSKAEGSKAEDSKAEDSKAEDSKAEDSKAEDPKQEDSKSEDPKLVDFKAEESQHEDSNLKDSLSGESKSEEPKSEEPKAEESKPEESKSEESKSEESKSEEPKDDDLKVEDSKAEAAKTETSYGPISENGIKEEEIPNKNEEGNLDADPNQIQNIPLQQQETIAHFPNMSESNSTVQVNQISSSGQDISPPSSNLVVVPDDDLDMITPFFQDLKNEESTKKVEVIPEVKKADASLVCGICQKQIRNLMEFRLHLVILHFRDVLTKRLQKEGGDAVQKCQICAKDCGNFEALLIHFYLGHDTAYLTDLYDKFSQPRCPHCSFFFPTPETLAIHIEVKHPPIECLVCRGLIHGDFDLHLMEAHFKGQLMTTALSTQYPTSCSACQAILATPQELYDHVVKMHNYAQLRYQQFAHVRPAQPVMPEAQSPEVFECICCKSQKIEDTFETIVALRIHLATKHFLAVIFNKLKVSLLKFPLCPIKDCTAMFNKMDLVKEHFRIHHKGMTFDYHGAILKCQRCYIGPFDDEKSLAEHIGGVHGDFVDGCVIELGIQSTLTPIRSIIQAKGPSQETSSLSAKERAIKKAIGYHCPNLGLTSSKPVTQKSAVIKQVKLENVNVQPSPAAPASNAILQHTQSTNVVHPPNSVQAPNAGKVVSLPTSSQTNAPPKVVLIPGQSVLRKDQFGPQIDLKPGQSLIRVQVVKNPANPTASLSSVLKNFRRKQNISEKVPELLREPDINEMMRFYDKISTDPRCLKCSAVMWHFETDGKTEEGRQRMTLIHILRFHLSEEMKLDLLNKQASKKSANLLSCPMCDVVEDEYLKIIDHYCVKHKMPVAPFWQLVTFGTTRLTKALTNPADAINKINEVDLSTFTDEANMSEISLGQAIKLTRIPLESTVIQPAACFLLSSRLEPCHECWKVIKGQGQVGSICQFEGFRKVKRVKSGPSCQFGFEPNGFLDPHGDPSKEDVSLWIDAPHAAHLDVETAKLILLRAGDEFCNLAKVELDLINEYKRKLSDDKCVIWKRLQKKVREMCDVCSTSLFNAHFTCTECGILVCIDCHQVRLKGNLAYQGTSSGASYKSRKRLIRSDLDTHYWPFCKIMGNVHKPERLILTQIICGDILADLAKNVHGMKAKLGMAFDCSCCKEKASLAKPSKKAKKPLPLTKAESVHSSFAPNDHQAKLVNNIVLEMKECPICGLPLSHDKPLKPGLHLVQHFRSELSVGLSIEPPHTCPKCSQEFKDYNLLMLHVGLDHGELQRLIAAYRKRKVSLKNIALKVDKDSSCKVCGMIYNDHMMQNCKVQIRIHLFTHFRDKINSMVIQKDGKFKCPLCEFEEPTMRNFAQHIGILHGHLDILVDELDQSKAKKKISLKHYVKKYQKPSTSSSAPTNEASEEEEANRPSSSAATPTYDLSACSICDIWSSRKSIRKHCIEHFEEELKEMVTKSDAHEACQDCGPTMDLVHLGLDHGWLEILLRKTQLVEQKREQFLRKKRRSSIDLHSSGPSKRHCPDPFKCILCGKVLPIHDHPGAVDHFATHVWIDLKHVRLQHTNNKWYNCLMSKLPLDDWLNHHGLEANDPKANGMLNSMMQRVHDIIQDKWCCLCLKVIDKDHRCDKALFQDLTSVEAIESLRVAPCGGGGENDKKEGNEDVREFCDYCLEGFKVNEFHQHMALGHFRKIFEVRVLPLYANGSRCRICHTSEVHKKEDLIMHVAKFHKQLERIIYTMEDQDLELQPKKVHDIFDELIDVSSVTKDHKVFHCKKCGSSYHDIQKIRVHVKDHFKKSWPLPKIGPYICPECFHESTTYLNLFKHVGTQHGHEPINSKITTSHVAPVANARPELPTFEAKKVLYTKKTFTIALPADQVAPKKTVKFSHFLTNLYKDAQACEPKEEPMEEEVSQTQLISNVHPPSRICSLQESKKTYQAPHYWLCDGKLLVLEDPKDPHNLAIFQDQWIRGQPVVVCNSSALLNKHLWHPRAFLNDFGHLKHDLVNCLTGKTVPKASLTKFWKGFENLSERIKDQSGTPMLLKLKDWPPTTDIASYVPKRFKDLIDAYPLHEYTHREGLLNLTSYLPDYCLKPELGPKMYIAYGSALYSDKASTNLHIDMSDAVNCLVYVGFPQDGNMEENAKEVFKEVDKAGCDILTKKRIRSRNILPGALWHIFHPSDTVKIRDFLNKVAIEKGVRLDPHDDPIHDQSTYLNGKLRKRLYDEYGVQGYAIVQCAGDTVFIPAGAAHQVRNLHNCIKVAEDFVSPENISHCLHLTQEFRHLTEWHTNHEDKLQIKTILFHAIKTALAVLQKN